MGKGWACCQVESYFGWVAGVAQTLLHHVLAPLIQRNVSQTHFNVGKHIKTRETHELLNNGAW